MYEPRTYRSQVKSEDLTSFRVVVSETDLLISCCRDLSKEAESRIRILRRDLEGYISAHPEFKNSLEPIAAAEGAPPIVKKMLVSAKQAGVGPMAAVAGAIAEDVGTELLKLSPEVVAENGGDIFISSKRTRRVGIYAGRSRLSGKITLELEADKTPCGICTSSGSVGHSLSFGKADAVVVISRSTLLADAAATSICNRVLDRGDIDKVIAYARTIKGIEGLLVIIEDIFGAWGDIKLVDN